MAELETTQPDPDKTTLHTLVKQISEKGLCPDCQRIHNYHSERKNQGVKTDYHQALLTPGTTMPGPPERIICEDCGTENNPLRDTCRKCKKPLSKIKIYDARGRLLYG